ncbi:MAG: N-acetylglucosamine-6-phosphate deacetylase [Sphingomonadales bacterium]|nr:N-acetylglucosamine-6-phosphate deacetylase [Sphingomonadales bacterium]
MPTLAGVDRGEGLALAVDGGRIAWIGPERDAPTGRRRVDLGGAMLLPGFIDVQVNGGGGVLFNDTPDPDAIAAIARAHYQYGTTGLLPTLISDSLDVVDAGITAVRAAIARKVPGVLGIHIEGPFLNPARKGIHDAALLARPTLDVIPRLAALRNGRTLVTLAPEMVPPGFVAALAAAGVIVSAGHSQASLAETRAALADGMTGFTHLFNAMPPMLNRDPGVVGAALDDQSAWCGLIVDGIHVDPAVLRIALRCRPHDRFLLVTDAMPVVGSPLTEFRLNGMAIDARDGRCIGPGGTLAGSALDMASAVRNAAAWLGLSLPQAVAMASANPAAFLGLSETCGTLAVGRLADLVIADEGVLVRQTWIAGTPVFVA